MSDDIVERAWFRCCEHCEEDVIHDLADNPGHSVACNAVNSRGCVGRGLVTGPAGVPVAQGAQAAVARARELCAAHAGDDAVLRASVLEAIDGEQA